MAIPNLATCLPCKLAIAHWLVCPTGIWKVVGLIPTGSSDFFSEHFLVVCNIYFEFQHTWVVGWLQSVHNTFLSKLVCCFGLVQCTHEMPSPVATPNL